MDTRVQLRCAYSVITRRGPPSLQLSSATTVLADVIHQTITIHTPSKRVARTLVRAFTSQRVPWDTRRGSFEKFAVRRDIVISHATLIPLENRAILARNWGKNSSGNLAAQVGKVVKLLAPKFIQSQERDKRSLYEAAEISIRFPETRSQRPGNRALGIKKARVRCENISGVKIAKLHVHAI